MPPMPRGLLAVRQVEILVAPFLELVVVGARRMRRRRPPSSRRGRRACRDPPGCAGGRAPASDRRRRRTTPWSSTTKRVFMCTAGTLGFHGWTISEMPDAQNRGSSSAPGICFRNSGENSPCTVEDVDAGLLEHPAVHHRHHAAAAVLALPWLALELDAVDLLEGGADLVPEVFEPAAGEDFPGVRESPSCAIPKILMLPFTCLLSA